MQFSRITLAVAALFGLSSAAVLDIGKRDSGLEVTLTAIENAVFKAVVKNVGSTGLNLLAKGTLFDTAPVEKLIVTDGGMYTNP